MTDRRGRVLSASSKRGTNGRKSSISLLHAMGAYAAPTELHFSATMPNNETPSVDDSVCGVAGALPGDVREVVYQLFARRFRDVVRTASSD